MFTEKEVRVLFSLGREAASCQEYTLANIVFFLLYQQREMDKGQTGLTFEYVKRGHYPSDDDLGVVKLGDESLAIPIPYLNSTTAVALFYNWAKVKPAKKTGPQNILEYSPEEYREAHGPAMWQEFTQLTERLPGLVYSAIMNHAAEPSTILRLLRNRPRVSVIPARPRAGRGRRSIRWLRLGS